MVLKKGFFFTIDSIIGSGIITLGILLLYTFYIVEPSYTSLDYTSHDLINSLSTLRVGEVNNAYIDELNSTGEITNPENTILEQIGEFWALDKIDKAGNLTKEFTDDFVDENLGFGFYIEGEKIYSRDNSQNGILMTSKKMISGIQRNRTREGFSARAFATKISKNTTEVFMIHPQGSSHGAGDHVYITKNFYLNSTNIINATLFLTVHWGISAWQSNDFEINNNHIDVGTMGPVGKWRYYQRNLDNTQIGFDVEDITSDVNQGWNELKIDLFGQASLHTHLHPGSRIEVEYESEGTFVPSEIVTERVYFDNIYSDGGQNLGKATGAWSIIPLYVPKGVEIKNATVHLSADNLDYFSIPLGIENQANIQIYSNDKVIDLLNHTGDFDKTYNINNNNITEGTNVISTYINCYNNSFFGKGVTQIYSDPENDPDGSSYVEITYEITDPQKLKYGKIDVSLVDRFTGNMNTTMVYNKDFGDHEIIESFVHVSQLDSESISLNVNGDEVFSTPRPLATPSSIYVDSDYIKDGVNTFEVIEDCGDCYILNETTLQYYVLIPSLVGYGQIFDSEEDAIANAEVRLNSLLGDYVQATQIGIVVNSVGGIPSLWGPIITEVRVWH